MIIILSTINVLSADEKERYEPQVFRDAIISGLEDVGNNHDQLLKYLCDTATVKLDVKRSVFTLLCPLLVLRLRHSTMILDGDWCGSCLKHFLVFRYGETLLDVLFVGGIISAGGAIEGNIRTNVRYSLTLLFVKCVNSSLTSCIKIFRGAYSSEHIGGIYLINSIFSDLSDMSGT